MRSVVLAAWSASLVVVFAGSTPAQDDFPVDPPPRVSAKSTISAPPTTSPNTSLLPVSEKRTVRRPVLSPTAPPNEILKFMENSLQVVADDSDPLQVRKAFEETFEDILKGCDQMTVHSQATAKQKDEARQYQASILYQGARMGLPNYREDLTQVANQLFMSQAKTDVANLANFLAVKGRHESDIGLAFTAFEDIKQYMGRYPREEAAIDLLLDMATTSELTAEHAQARKAYEFIQSKFPRHEIIAKIPFVMKRLDLVNKPLAYDFQDHVTGQRITPQRNANRVVAIHFWATWCQACQAEMEILKELRRTSGGELEVIGVPLDKQSQAEAAVRSYVKDHKIDWPQHAIPTEEKDRGEDHPFAKQVGVFVLPTTMILDRNGQVVETNCRGDRLRTRVKQILGRSNSAGIPRITNRFMDEPPAPPK